MALYETVEETQTRLYQTVIQYKGEPAWVDSVFNDDHGMIKIKIITFPRANEYFTLGLDDPGLELFRYNIGYVNLGDGASYMTRIPSKGAYKQGLYRHNTSFTPTRADRNRPEWAHVYKQPGFRDMLQGKYPSFEEAVKRLDLEGGGPVSVAFDRCFCVHKDSFRGDVILNYKGERIGFGSDAFQVPNEFSHLREVINKSKIRVR